MTTKYLIEDLKKDEGLRSKAYNDPLTGGKPYTIGYGHTGADVYIGLIWTKEQAERALENDLNDTFIDLDRQLPWWRNLSDLRQDVLANMCFNMGIKKLLLFIHTLAAIKKKDWYGAAIGMRDSLWAKQVGARADRLSKQMLLNQHD